MVNWQDLTALPCSHPHCASVGYLLRNDSGEWKSLAKIIGHDRLKEHLGLISNRIADRDLPRDLRLAVQESLMGLLSEQSSLSHPEVMSLWKDVCEACDLGIGSLLRATASLGLPGGRNTLRRMLGERVKRITIKPFMDINTMIEERLTQCCVHVGSRTAEQNQCAPFCAVQAWPQLSAQRLSTSYTRARDGLEHTP